MYKQIKIKNLDIYAKNEKIVKNINLEISVNKPLVLLGESGSGKSLIMDAVIGTLANSLKTKGEILLDDIDLLKLDYKKREKLWGKQIALLPQEPWRALDPTMKILEQVKEVHKYIHKKDNKTSYIESIKDLKEVELEKNTDSYSFELSGGMCQRATLAITHAANAQVILVDEPTKGLDKELCDSVVEKLQEEVSKRRLVFIITHDIDIAKKIDGTLGIVVDGNLVEYGNSKEVLDNPKHEYTKELLSSEPLSWDIQKVKINNTRLIKVENVSKSFNKNLIFKNLSFDLNKGEIVSIVGKSGSGKSTLGNIMLDLIKLDKGKIKKDTHANKIQYQKIYQDPPSAFLPNQLLFDGLKDLMLLHNISESKLDNMLIEFKLDKLLLSRLPDEVSGGELQRIAIIRALLLNPVFLFADEATSRLDPISQKEVILLLINLVKKNNLSLLIITHDINLAKKISNQVIYLNDYK
ncbi:MAG: ABC transporter ATP-binding protein [Arcobacter sp.]|nr:MAG: ABC transporter ATP-binding protein [Arcobacter sp.]